jgi:hypothetical protein
VSEQEADKIADLVMRSQVTGDVPGSQGGACCSGCASGGGCDGKVQRQSANSRAGTGAATADQEQLSDDIESRIRDGGSAGQPLPGPTRAFFEPRLGVTWVTCGCTPEVMEVRGNRMALVRGIVDGLTDASLERACLRLPAPGFQDYPEETRSVGRCLRVVMQEECEHHRYAVRDLMALEADLDGGATHHVPP